PMAGLQDMAPMVANLWVTKAVCAPMRAAAPAASQPAWPPPITTTSNRIMSLPWLPGLYWKGAFRSKKNSCRANVSRETPGRRQKGCVSRETVGQWTTSTCSTIGYTGPEIGWNGAKNEIIGSDNPYIGLPIRPIICRYRNRGRSRPGCPRHPPGQSNGRVSGRPAAAPRRSDRRGRQWEPQQRGKAPLRPPAGHGGGARGSPERIPRPQGCRRHNETRPPRAGQSRLPSSRKYRIFVHSY